MLKTAILTLAFAALAVAPAAAQPTLKARAILPADASWPAPFPGAPNTEPVPAAGARQPVGGFSALLQAPWRGCYLAMPDNGFGNKANSRSFLFGPFLLHTDASGKVLEKPIPLPGVRSPDNPLPGPAPNLASSNGFEGMAISPDGRTLYPTLEGPLTDDADKTIRRSYTFDIASRRYQPGYRSYHVADPAYLVSDLTALDSKRFVSLERDNFQGPAAQHKKAFVIDARHGTLTKRLVLDELNIADPALISLPGRPGDFGLGNPFKMPYVTIEAVLPLHGNQLAIVNDTNFGSTGRNPSLPDNSDFIRVLVPGLRAH